MQGHEQDRVPRSEYFFTLLQGPLDKLFHPGAAYKAVRNTRRTLDPMYLDLKRAPVLVRLTDRVLLKIDSIW
jgi:hypothetical protein